MRNVTEYMIKTSIVIPSDAYSRIVDELFPGFKVYFDLDGLYYSDGRDDLEYEVLYAKLAEYFGVKKVTSVHIDDCDDIGVWITYKD